MVTTKKDTYFILPEIVINNKKVEDNSSAFNASSSTLKSSYLYDFNNSRGKNFKSQSSSYSSFRLNSKTKDKFESASVILNDDEQKIDDMYKYEIVSYMKRGAFGQTTLCRTIHTNYYVIKRLDLLSQNAFSTLGITATTNTQTKNK